MSVADDLDRPPMPAAPKSAGAAARIQPGKQRLTFGAMPTDVVETLREWGEGTSATAIVVAMVRWLDRPELAVARARIFADAAEIHREAKRR